MWKASDHRYDTMQYRRCGNSGLKLPAISLGLWKNFGADTPFERAQEMCRTAFDLGITHFDLANNYGHPHNGSAEENFGRILRNGLGSYRDELCISTKAGYEMWEGPYGDRNGSRKYLTASLDQSLRRMGLDYVDIFYHHVFDPDTPLEETALALDHLVWQGKALYVGISNYNKAQTAQMLTILRELKTPFIVNQPSYSMLNRWVEEDGLDAFCAEQGIGLSVFSPLAQGFLTSRYLRGIPEDSRIGKGNTWLGQQLSEAMLTRLGRLNDIARARGQSLSQLAIAWLLHNPAVVTVLTGASSPGQIIENVRALEHPDFTKEEIADIEAVLQA
ncbi:MAG: aldo/keto reductase [Oscillospiraceae bacterium]|nr:aldo/keto reductase [Oscillospiraceae bacterium]